MRRQYHRPNQAEIPCSCCSCRSNSYGEWWASTSWSCLLSPSIVGMASPRPRCMTGAQRAPCPADEDAPPPQPTPFRTRSHCQEACYSIKPTGSAAFISQNDTVTSSISPGKVVPRQKSGKQGLSFVDAHVNSYRVSCYFNSFSYLVIQDDHTPRDSAKYLLLLLLT